MTRGNQRENARKANMKKQQGQKGKNTESGTQMQRSREDAAEKMRAKQAAHNAKLAEDEKARKIADAERRRGGKKEDSATPLPVATPESSKVGLAKKEDEDKKPPVAEEGEEGEKEEGDEEKKDGDGEEKEKENDEEEDDTKEIEDGVKALDVEEEEGKGKEKEKE